MIDLPTAAQPPADRHGRFRRAMSGPVVAAAAALSAAFLGTPQHATSQVRPGEPVSITGRVVDAVTGNPVPGVQVAVRGLQAGGESGLTAETDVEGQFHLAGIAVGEYWLELSHPDYNPAAGEFTVMRAGGFVTAMKPLSQGSEELLTGIIGVVTDRESGALLSGVRVSAGGGQGVFSDLRGEFVLERLVGGQHVVELSMIGYHSRADTIRVVPGRVTTVQVSLSVDPVQLEPIEVSVERREVVLQRRGFYHRQRVGFGKFIDRETIEQRAPTEMTDLFSGLAGVELYSAPFSQLEKWVVLRSGRFKTPKPRGGEEEESDPTDIYERCFPRVYVDGFVVHSGGDEPARLDTFVDPASVSGVEVYATISGLPPEYQGVGAFCGTILIWTRR